MKALLYFLSILSVSFTGYGQFFRGNNFYPDALLTCWSVCSVSSPENDIETITACFSEPNTVQIKTQRFDQRGELTDVWTDETPVGFNGYFIKVAGVFNNGSTRVVCLELVNNTEQRLAWVQLSGTSQHILSVYEHPTSFRINHTESILHNTEYVSYQVGPEGLIRISFNPATSAISTEVVNASISAAAPAQAGRAGVIALVNNKEYLDYAPGHTTPTIYERLAGNSYVTHSLSGTNYLQANMEILPGGNFTVFSSGERQKYSGSFQLLSSIPCANQTIFTAKRIGDKIHTTGFISGKVVHLILDTNLHTLDSVSCEAAIIPGAINALNGKVCITGSLNSSYIDHMSDGIYFTPHSFILYDDELNLDNLREYASKIQMGNFSITAGLGSYPVTQDLNEKAGLFYNDSIQLIRALRDIPSGRDVQGNPLGYDGAYSVDYASAYLELPGPFTSPELYNDVIESKYNRGFFVTRESITAHLDSLSSGSASYVPDRNILYWPAHGDVSLGQEANLAPFADINNNGVYEPMLGDYPKIYGDRCFFTITHSNPATSNSPELEFHSFLYQVYCDTSDAFDDVLFRKLKVFPKNNQLDTLYLLTFSETDLGFYGDDYAGTDVGMGSVYFYQGDSYDQNDSYSAGFKNKSPGLAILQLRGAKLVSDNSDNASDEVPNGVGFGDGIVDNEYYTIQTSLGPLHENMVMETIDGNPEHFLNPNYGREYLGYQPTINSYSTKYYMPGNSDPTFYGTNGNYPGAGPFEYDNENGISDEPGNRNTHHSSGPSKIESQEPLEFDQAIVFTIAPDGTNTIPGGVIPYLQQKCAAIRSAFVTGNGPCGNLFEPIANDLDLNEYKLLELSVYPNPTTSNVTISGLPSDATVTICDVNGRTIEKRVSTQPDVSIDMTNLDPALYLLKVESADGNFYGKVTKK